MTAATSSIDRATPYRLMGGFAMAGGACYFVTAMIMEQTGNETHAVANALSALWALGCIAGLAGISMLGVAGRGALARSALAVATLSYALAALDAILVATSVVENNEDDPLFAISRLGSIVGMLLLGIATVAARRWDGWRRYSPFVLLVAVVIALPLGAALDLDHGIIPFVAISWIVIGFAVLSTRTE